MTTHAETPWPCHSDGRPKKMGEMTTQERRTQFKDAVAKVKALIETPAKVKERLAATPGRKAADGSKK